MVTQIASIFCEYLFCDVKHIMTATDGTGTQKRSKYKKDWWSAQTIDTNMFTRSLSHTKNWTIYLKMVGGKRDNKTLLLSSHIAVSPPHRCHYHLRLRPPSYVHLKRLNSLICPKTSSWSHSNIECREIHISSCCYMMNFAQLKDVSRKIVVVETFFTDLYVE